MNRKGKIVWLKLKNRNQNIYAISPNDYAESTVYNTGTEIEFIKEQKKIELKCSFHLYDYRVLFNQKKDNILEGDIVSEGKNVDVQCYIYTDFRTIIFAECNGMKTGNLIGMHLY